MNNKKVGKDEDKPQKTIVPRVLPFGQIPGQILLARIQRRGEFKRKHPGVELRPQGR